MTCKITPCNSQLTTHHPPSSIPLYTHPMHPLHPAPCTPHQDLNRDWRAMKSQLQSSDGGSGAVQSTTAPSGPGARGTLIGSRLVEGRSAASVDNQLQMCHRLIHLWKSVEDLEHGQAVSAVAQRIRHPSYISLLSTRHLPPATTLPLSLSHSHTHPPRHFLTHPAFPGG